MSEEDNLTELLRTTADQLQTLMERVEGLENTLTEMTIKMGALNKELTAHKQIPHLTMDIQSLFVNLTNAFSLGFQRVLEVQTPRGKELEEPPPKRDWRDDPATEKQLETLDKAHISYKQGITKGEASKLLEEAFKKVRRT